MAQIPMEIRATFHELAEGVEWTRLDVRSPNSFYSAYWPCELVSQTQNKFENVGLSDQTPRGDRESILSGYRR